MAVKRIGFFEEHVEKIVLGVAGAGLVGVLVYQFIGPKPEVSVPSGVGAAKVMVPVTDAWPRIENDAKKLKADMERTPEPPDFKSAGGALKSFETALRSPVAKGGRQLVKAGPEGAGTTQVVKSAAADVYNVPVVPGLSRPVAAAYMSNVDKGEADESPDVAKIMPPALPFDIPAVTVETTFSGEDLRKALALDPDGTGPIKAIPPIWSEGLTAAFYVEATREELQPDGSWSGTTVLAPMPGRFTLFPDMSKTPPGRESYDKLVVRAMEDELAILRPDWYRATMLNGNPIGGAWRAPTDRATNPANNEGAEIRQFKKQLKTNDDDETRLRNAIRVKEREIAGKSGGGGGGGGKQVDPRPNPNSGTKGQADPRVKQLETLKKQLEDNLLRGKELRDSLAKAGQIVRVKKDDVGARLTTDASTQMWVHDPSVKRGRTYRYKMQLWVSNPLFARVGLDDSQKDIAKQVALKSPYSDWSEPVTVDEETVYFITNATDAAGAAKGGLARPAYATGEIFKFQWGYCGAARVNLEPGDQLYAKTEIPDFEALLKEAPKPVAPAGGPNQPPAPPNREAPAPGGGRRIGVPEGDRPPPGNPNPANPNNPANPPAAPAKEVPKKPLIIERDTIFLDVATEMATKQLQAYLREVTGAVIGRRSDVDKADRRLKELRDSAAEGETFLSLKPVELEKKPDGKKPPGEALPPPPGGGGGGG